VNIRPRLDPLLLIAVSLLLTVGAFMIYSASLVVAYNELQDDTYFLNRQLIWIGIGALVMVILARVDYRLWQRYSFIILLIGIGLLVLVLVPGYGTRSYGSARWIKPVPFFQIQPSELIKLALVLYMADWLASKGKRVGEFFQSSLPFLIILSIVCGLVVVEPDFGTTVVIAITAISIFFVAGANLLHFVAGVGLMVGALWFVMTQASYRVQRIGAWLDPWQDSQGAGWHTIQTLIALGSGGLTGLGLGASRQKHSWVPNAHTDAIMAILGEELGFVGVLAVLALFAVVIWRGLRIAYQAPDAYGRLLAAGLTTMLFWQAALNLAVVTNTVPYTGVTLPFLSFGGSSTIVSLSAVGLLLSIARHRSAAVDAIEDQSDPRRGKRRLARTRTRAAVEHSHAPLGKLEPIPLANGRRSPSRGSRGRGH
jgi:cell division protein FtsW